MTDLTELLKHGSTNGWVLAPGAILLGALHGLEPGHSKTMMAAFIIAVRGTVAQAVMLGVAATLSHTAVVWAVAMIGLRVGEHWNAESTEPYFRSVSGVIIIGMAFRMLWRIRRQQSACGHDHDHSHGHDHDHDHDHGHAHDHTAKSVDTGHGVVRLEIFETGVPPRFRIYEEGRAGAREVSVETERADGSRQAFAFVRKETFWESEDTVPEPHEFMARLKIAHHGHAHDFDVEFTEEGHAHALPETGALEALAQGSTDAHELAHANDIRRRFSGREVTTGQIILFGLTGGLIPCPAAITVLMFCLQLKRVTLGAALVAGFSVGLAITLVASGVLAALSLRFASKRWAGFGGFSQKAPYFSGALMLAVGLYILWHGVHGLMA